MSSISVPAHDASSSFREPRLSGAETSKKGEKDCSGDFLSARVNGQDVLEEETGLDDKEWRLEREKKEERKGKGPQVGR
jgi:hypothetical protein